VAGCAYNQLLQVCSIPPLVINRADNNLFQTLLL